MLGVQISIMKRRNSHQGDFCSLAECHRNQETLQKRPPRSTEPFQWEGTFSYRLPVSSFSRFVLGYPMKVMPFSVPKCPWRARRREREWIEVWEKKIRRWFNNREENWKITPFSLHIFSFVQHTRRNHPEGRKIMTIYKLTVWQRQKCW